MEAKLNKRELAKVLEVSTNAYVSSKSVSAFNSIILEANSDGVSVVFQREEMWITSSLEKASVSSSEQATPTQRLVVDAKSLKQIVKSLPEDEFTISIDSFSPKSLSISCTGVQSSLPLEDYTLSLPTFSEDGSLESLEISRKEFEEAIKSVAFAASADKMSREILSGVHLKAEKKKIQAHATDTHRFAYYHKPIDLTSELEVVIPIQALKLFLKTISSATVKISRSQESLVRMTSGTTSIITRSLEGAFPKLSQVNVPASLGWVLVPKADFLDTVKWGTRLVSKDVDKKLALYLNKNSFQVTAAATTRVIPTVKSDGQAKCVLNGKYLAESVSAVDLDHVKISITGEESPVTVTGMDPEKGLIGNTGSIIMPVIV